MKRLVLALTMGALGVGCGEHPTGTVPELPPPFQGDRAPKRIDFDLAGTWKVMRFGTRDHPGRLPPSSAEWKLQKRAPCLWVDENGQGTFWLRPRGGEMLCWASPNGWQLWFSVNECSFGSLTMTADDGERYYAVRTEGGERPKSARHLGDNR